MCQHYLVYYLKIRPSVVAGLSTFGVTLENSGRGGVLKRSCLKNERLKDIEIFTLINENKVLAFTLIDV